LWDKTGLLLKKDRGKADFFDERIRSLDLYRKRGDKNLIRKWFISCYFCKRQYLRRFLDILFAIVASIEIKIKNLSKNKCFQLPKFIFSSLKTGFLPLRSLLSLQLDATLRRQMRR